ncbi:MAG TPA: hypothetical protein VMJ10_00260 [Kofleriaceae bacterium]|nr:hypothetical protein [Kofleriaceae bacterium]
MGTPLGARTLTVLVIVAPWLVWLPNVQGTLAVAVLGAIALAGAFHGWGRLVARLARCELGAALAIWWGIAAVLALSGLGIALHVYDPRALVIGGAVAHAIEVALAFDGTARALEQALRWERVRYWIVPFGLVVVLGGLRAVGAAGSVGARPFDDDGHVIAQVKRLLDTGALADPIGYAREAQLGGHAVLAGLVGAFGDARSAHAVDALAFVLVLVLALAELRPRDAASATWSSLLVIGMSATIIHWPDFTPQWLAVGLLLALYVTTDRARGALGVGLLAGGACVLRDELVPVACVLLAYAWWRERAPWHVDRARVLALVVTAAAVVVPYVLARHAAWASVDRSARALVEPAHAGFIARLALFVVVAAASLPLLWLPWRELGGTRLRWFGVAAACGFATIAIAPATERPIAAHYVWAIALAGFDVLAIEAASRRELVRVAFVAAALACVLVGESRSSTVHQAFWLRYYDLLHDIAYLRAAAPEPPAYDVLAVVPPGETVAVWVSRPELLDYARNRIVDLRTRRTARLRVPGPYDRRLEELVAATRARWLVLETDDAYVQRANDNSIYELACARDRELCADSLEALAYRHRVVAEHDGVKLIALREP